MSNSLNKVMLIGFLGADPEQKSAANGDSFATVRLATSDTWKDANTGEKHERTEWHNIVIFNENIADFAIEYLKKGAKVYIEGKLQTRKWQDQNGNDRYSTEIVIGRFDGDLIALTAAKE